MIRHLYKIIILTGLVFIPSRSFTQTREVPFTLEDRDRIIQMNEKLNSQQKQIDDLKETMQKQFDIQQQQINDLKEQNNELRNLFYWGFGIIISMILFLLGFIIWDRRTVTEPIREKMQTLLQVLREYSREQPKLSEILRAHGV